MKYLITIAMLCYCLSAIAQIKGNGQLVSKSFDVADLKELEISLYAKIEIDCSSEPFMEISAEENIIEQIKTDIDEGRLNIDQKQWVSPSQPIVIKIGAPNLTRIQQNTHETAIVKSIDSREFSAMAIVGEIVLNGKVEQLNASGEIGTIKAKELIADEVNVNLWDDGIIYLGNPSKISGIVKSEGQVLYSGNDTKVTASVRKGAKISNYNAAPVDSRSEKGPHYFIKFKIKNNSGNRINCYVVGPKNDGKKFSYGFPMNPGQVRDKDWSVGSKVYRVTGIGTRKLLTVIEANDEGNVVNLYDN